MKFLLKALLVAVILFWLWNTLTCQFCPRDSDGEAMTLRECRIGNSLSPITWQYQWAGWEVHVYIPFVGCFVNDPTPVEVFGFRVEGWFKGWHQVKIAHLRLQ